jgi:hypothetical protein
MNKIITCTLAGACMLLALPLWAAGRTNPSASDAGSLTKTITVDIQGRLSKGTVYEEGPIVPLKPDRASLILRPGRLREAWFVTVGKVQYELDFAGSKELLDQAGKLLGQTVVLTGRLEDQFRLMGCIARSSQVVVVTSMKAGSPDYIRQTTHVNLQGRLEFDPTEIYRPFGVYWYVNVQGQHYYLHFGTNSSLLKLAGSLTGSRLAVTGTLEQHGRWLIVHVSSVTIGNAR